MTTMTTEVDLLVLGAGMAGLSAAAWSVKHGRSVVLVEKGEIGGSAKRARFIWTAPDYETLREAIPDGDPELQRRLIEGFEPAVEWVHSLVEAEPPVTVLRFGRGQRTPMPDYVAACERLVREHAGSEVIVGGDAQRLLVEDGEVRGAEIRLPSGELREVRAASTLLATGGFGGDPQLRTELIHPQADDIPLRANPFSRGDGLRLGREAGGQFGPDDAGFYGHVMANGVELRDDDDFPALTLFHSEHGILLNVDGERFVDETLGDHLTTLALLKEREARALLISDQRVHDEWIMRPYVQGVAPVDVFDLVSKRGARALKLDSIDELAGLPAEWGYDGAAIRQALLDFNRACAAGTPEPPRRLDAVPIDSPPFYVIEAVPAITFTFGGLRIDRDARVLGEDGRPIPGLLAAGADAGGVYVRAYAGGLALALVFGLRAAQTALERAAVEVG
jgi:succinate dehydrogenase/fumarate reductase flavoprotein subunit